MAAHKGMVKTVKGLSNILENVGMKPVGTKKMRSPKQLERHIKGIANHRRIEILLLVAKYPGVSLDQISQTTNAHFKTISEHSRRLVQAGLVEKNYRGKFVVHSLTPFGKIFVRFLQSF